MAYREVSRVEIALKQDSLLYPMPVIFPLFAT